MTKRTERCVLCAVYIQIGIVWIDLISHCIHHTRAAVAAIAANDFFCVCVFFLRRWMDLVFFPLQQRFATSTRFQLGHKLLSLCIHS